MTDVDKNTDAATELPLGEDVSTRLKPFLLLTKELVKNSSLPLNISSTRTVMEDLVHLFKRLAICLWDAEVGPYKRQQAKDGKEDVSPEAGLLNEGWSNEADDEIP